MLYAVAADVGKISISNERKGLRSFLRLAQIELDTESVVKL